MKITREHSSGLPVFSILTILTVFAVSSALAVKTERWELKSPQDFMRGKLDGLIVTSEGELRLGYADKKLAEFAKEVWCSTVADDGTIYFGTGSPADVYAIDKDGHTTKVFETESVAVTSLAFDSRGNLYAATLAEGIVYKISPAKKQGAPFSTLSSPYVWSLIVDKDDRLFAGTGPDGKIYRLEADGKAEEWFASDESNILTIAFDADGSLLAGGSDRGLLYRIAEKGKGTVLHQFAEDEVKSLLVSGTDLYVGVNKQKVRRPRPAAGRRLAEIDDLSPRPGPVSIPRAAEPSEHARETPPETRVANLLAGTLYVRNGDGRIDRINSWDNEAIMNMALDLNHEPLIATSGQGRVYRVHANKQWELLFDLEEQQALTLAMREGKLAFIGTGNIGNGYLIDSQKVDQGEFVSEVRDLHFLTTWGNLSWLGAGSIAVSTRTGNTALPDSTWSEWSMTMVASPAKVTSPRARFVQLRAQLKKASDAAVASLALYSQTQNQRPEVTSVDFGEKARSDNSKGEDDKGSTTESAKEDFRPKPANPVKRISWRAADKDGDALVYRLYYRSIGDENWLPVFPEDKPLRKSEYFWDTESVPDGWYHVKVIASDEESNPAGQALSDERTSEVLKIDNRRPEILQLSFDATTALVTGIARDNLSLIRFLEYSVDGGEWKFFATKDGVFDDREEPFEIKLTGLAKGPHVLAVRATDEEGNIGAEKISLLLR